jgi:hypothetical protein
MAVESSKCGSCGARLPLALPGVIAIRCLHCGASFQVPGEHVPLAGSRGPTQTEWSEASTRAPETAQHNQFVVPKQRLVAVQEEIRSEQAKLKESEAVALIVGLLCMLWGLAAVSGIGSLFAGRNPGDAETGGTIALVNIALIALTVAYLRRRTRRLRGLKQKAKALERELDAAL